MIRYSLSCTDGHHFDSWFQSADAFDKLQRAGLVSCAICGQGEVKKTLMAPALGTQAKHAAPATATDTTAAADVGPLRQPASPAEQALAALKKKIVENSDYVGADFADEARAIHEGDAPRRAIYGEARADEAKRLLDDGVPVTPLPFNPTQKTN